MGKFIIIISTLAGAIWFYNRYDHLSGWLYAINIFLGGFMGFSISALLTKASGNSKRSSHTSQAVGIIHDLNYSTIRINNMPRFKATVKYMGIEKVFEPLDPNTHLSLSVGDKAVIMYNPSNVNDSHFDFKASVKLKRKG